MSNRDEYFRVRTNIGKLEAAALRFATTRGHDPFVVRDDRQGTSVGCNNCSEWGCAEIEKKIEIVHGPIFEDACVPDRLEEEALYASNPALY